jgi:hypothetical protein
LPDTIMDRSVALRMRRRVPSEKVTPYRHRVTGPAGRALGEQLARWAASVAERVGKPWPTMPEGVEDRPSEVWEPLLMVADLVGGQWPERARAACVELVKAARDDRDSGSAGLRLLADLWSIWWPAEDGEPVLMMPTEAILDGLRALDESPWSMWYGTPLDPRGLARMLGEYGVKPTKIRIKDRSVRGYRLDGGLLDAWSRYLGVPHVPDAESVRNALTSEVPHVPHVPQGRGTGANGRDPFAD